MISRATSSRPRARHRTTSPAAAQGLYYLITGIWPILSIRSFEAVTGPKRDRWLVQTVGMLIAVVGATLLLGARRRHVTKEVRFLGVASAVGFIGVDVIFNLMRKIGPVYLLDALAQLILIGWWRSASRVTPRSSAPAETSPLPRRG